MMDTSPEQSELYGVYDTKQQADKAVAEIKKWAAQIRAIDAFYGVVGGDWEINRVREAGLAQTSSVGVKREVSVGFCWLAGRRVGRISLGH
jgi:hypothetical protein